MEQHLRAGYGVGGLPVVDEATDSSRTKRDEITPLQRDEQGLEQGFFTCTVRGVHDGDAGLRNTVVSLSLGEREGSSSSAADAMDKASRTFSRTSGTETGNLSILTGTFLCYGSQPCVAEHWAGRGDDLVVVV
jgi:hypothetical protein